MAKQLVNPLERHVEKAVVGVAGLILIGVIARYVVTSPNKLELGSDKVTPATIDARIAQKALSIQERVRQTASQVERPEPLAAEFEKSVAPIRPDPLPRVASLNPEVPIVDRGGAKLGDAKLVTVLPLPKPLIISGRSTWELRSAAVGGSTTTQTSVIASNWVTVSSVIDVKAQSAQQRIDYMPALGDVYFGPMQLERRARRPDGTWSDEDWKAAANWPPVILPREPRIQLVDAAGRLSVSRETQQAIGGFMDAVSKPAMQLDLLRPMPPFRSNGSLWKFPLIGGCENVLRQDDEYLFPNEPPAGNPQDRYGFCRNVAAELPQAAKIQAELDAIEKLIAAALQNLARELAVEAHNRAVAIFQDPEAGQREKGRAQDLIARADTTEKEIQRKIRLEGAKPKAPGDAGPAKSAREKLPQQQAWVIDAAPGSVASDGVFQYRIRATLLNRWLGEPERFRDPADATVAFVTGSWSEPSDPVVIPPDAEFYVTGGDEKDKLASIEMFQWYEGVWVQARRAKLGVGDRVTIESTCKVPTIDNPEEAEDIKVEFDARSLLVDVDFDRLHREKRKGAGKAGVKIGPAERSTSAAYLDADGELRERWVTVDKGHPGKRSASDRQWKPK